VQYCAPNGASYTLSHYCTSETYCKTFSATEAGCELKPCVAGAVGCVGEDYGTCASDGVALEAGFDDCDGKGQVCSLDGCAASAVDDLGGTSDIESLSSGTVAFDRIHVTKARKLTQIAAYLSLPSTRTLRWTVYSKLGWYDWQLIFDQVTTANGAQYHSSNAMELTLEADQDYLVGVAVTGGSFASYVDPASVQTLSFGSAVEAASASYSSTISYYQPSGRLRAMRLTTALP
jgi:hypothetical protein